MDEFGQAQGVKGPFVFTLLFQQLALGLWSNKFGQVPTWTGSICLNFCVHVPCSLTGNFSLYFGPVLKGVNFFTPWLLQAGCSKYVLNVALFTFL